MSRTKAIKVADNLWEVKSGAITIIVNLRGKPAILVKKGDETQLSLQPDEITNLRLAAKRAETLLKGLPNAE